MKPYHFKYLVMSHNDATGQTKTYGWETYRRALRDVKTCRELGLIRIRMYKLTAKLVPLKEIKK